MTIVGAIICPTVRSAGGEVERPRVAGSPGEKVRGRIWELEATGWRPAAQAKVRRRKSLWPSWSLLSSLGRATGAVQSV